jgi:signal transduction histidine kinase
MSSDRMSASFIDIRVLRNRILAYTMTGVLLMVLLTAGLVLMPLYSNLRQAQEERLVQTAQVRTAAIEQVLWRARSVAQQVTSRTRARELLEQYSRNEAARSEYLARTAVILSDALRLSDELAGITRLDPGRTAAVAVGKPVPVDMWPLSGTVSALQISGPVSIDGAAYVMVAAPIRDPADQKVGLDLLLFNFQTFEQIMERGEGLGRSGQAVLLAPQNGGLEILASGGAAAVPNVREMTWIESALQKSLAAVSARRAFRVSANDHHRRRLVAVARVDDGPEWVVAVSMATAELYSRLNRQLAIVVACVLVLAVAGSGGTYLILRPLAGGILLHADGLKERIEQATQALQAELEERKAAEERANRSARALAESNRDLEQFAYVASHDLREPLRTVAGFAELLQRRYGSALDPSAAEIIQFIVDGAQRGQNLIADLLDYSRVGTRKMAAEVVLPAEIVKQVVAGLHATVQESQAAVEWSDLPPVLVDPIQLSRLFQNLINNAIRFRTPGRPPCIDISAQQQEGWVELAVQDNGVGIEKDQQERIFEVFQRLHGPEIPGTGMGLAIARRIVERHGGRIWVVSEPGAGSTFRFTLPAPPVMQASKAEMPAAAASEA